MLKFKKLFKKTQYITVSTQDLEIVDKKREEEKEQKPNVPDGLWVKCPECGKILYKKELKENLLVCYYCNHHLRMNAIDRINSLLDEGTFIEMDSKLEASNPIDFSGYKEKIEKEKEKSGLKDAVITGEGKLKGKDVIIGVMDSNFMMGSMGSVVGEKLTRAIEYATLKELPIIIFTTSGGARMQEGIYSLMQMAKVSGAISKHSNKGLLYITVLTDPTTGGVTASFAMLGDIILSEPKALVGFAGRRVIAETLKEELPEDFQRAEFLLEHGFVDKIVERKNMKDTIYNILKLHEKKENYDSFTAEEVFKERLLEDNLTPWHRISIARDNNRPTAKDYIERIITSFIELHGDRTFSDDSAVLCGLGELEGIPVTIIAEQKGKSTKENIKRNFGMPHPEGYRKALRFMKSAEKFNRPIICFIDTPGAFCGVGAEERGQGQAIAQNLLEMFNLKVPIISIVIGEGGSGGALALGVADRVLMLKNSVYSILSPEGFATILWKDSTRAKEAANVMKVTSLDLKKYGIIDSIIEENDSDGELNLEKIAKDMKNYFIQQIKILKDYNPEKLMDMRYEKYRKMGEFIE